MSYKSDMFKKLEYLFKLDLHFWRKKIKNGFLTDLNCVKNMPRNQYIRHYVRKTHMKERKTRIKMSTKKFISFCTSIFF